MTQILPATASACPPCRGAIIRKSEPIPGHSIGALWNIGVPVGRSETTLSVSAVTGGSKTTLSVNEPVPATPGAQPLPPREREFWLERAHFQMIPNAELVEYEGRYVASRGGRIVESDSSLEGLADRFFKRYGDVPVYMTKVGHEEEERIDTPFE